MLRIIFISLVFINSFAFGMNEPNGKSLVQLNFGGYLVVTTMQTIEHSGMTFFNGLFSGKFNITHDSQGNIFIDRSQKEGEFIDDFIRTHELPHHCDLKLAGQVADFFGSDELGKLIEKKQARKLKKLKTMEIKESDFLKVGYYYCPLCFDLIKHEKIFWNSVIVILDHLVNIHRIGIIDSKVYYRYEQMPRNAEDISYISKVELKYIFDTKIRKYKFKTIVITPIIKEGAVYAYCPLCNFSACKQKCCGEWPFGFRNHLVQSHQGMFVDANGAPIIFIYPLTKENKLLTQNK